MWQMRHLLHVGVHMRTYVVTIPQKKSEVVAILLIDRHYLMY